MRRFHRWLLVGVLGIISRPRAALLVAGVLLVLCGGWAWSRLNISTDQNKLFDPHVRFFRDYLKFNELFPENESIYVLVEPKEPQASPPVPRWTALADDIAQRLRNLPQYVSSVDSKVPIDQLGAQGLLFDQPQQVRQTFQQVKQQLLPLMRLWAEPPNIAERFLGATPSERFLSALAIRKPDAQSAAFVQALAQSWNQALAHPDRPLAAGAGLPDLAMLDAQDPSRLGYYYVPDDQHPDRHLLLVRVDPRRDFTSLTAISQTVEAIRSAARQAAAAYPEFTVGITGRPALEADEMRTTDQDTNRAEIAALIAVFVGLVVMLRSLWLAVAGELALGVGIGWTFGWATLTVGELNLLSIVFLLALIGIGMDYLVQILVRYRQEVARRHHAKLIWISVFRHVAAPINTACLGAAGAFAVSIFTNFRGAAELGIIAGGGLLLCLIAGYVILPALLTIFPVRPRGGVTPKTPMPPARSGWRNFLWPAVWVAALAVGMHWATRTSFNPGLLNMQAPNLESVQLIGKLQTWSAVILTKDLDVLRTARQAVGHLPTVKNTDSILMAYDNLAWLQAHEAELGTVQWTAPPPVQAADLPRLERKARNLAQHLAAAATQPANQPPAAYHTAAAVLNQFATSLATAHDPAATARRLSAWQSAFVDDLHGLFAAFHPAALDIAALPRALRGHYVADDGTFALYIYPTQDLWHQKNLARFVHDVEQAVVAVPGQPMLTGIAINIFHSTASIADSFYRATLYALGLILLLVFIDLRSLGQTVLAVSVLALGLPMLVAIMGLLGIDWNFANFFGLPILIGAGHEYGVFLVHRYREALHDPRRIWRRWDASDRGLLLCAYITCSSFGFFGAMAHHRGLQSLGIVMAIGIACIYLAAVCVLRPLLVWRLNSQRG
jgi:predicted RND superfamily exporter protein